jgi:uncharacterized protein with HEPN domain
MNPNDIRHLKNIIVLIDKMAQNTENVSFDDFMCHPLLPDSCAMNIIAVGEQVDRLTDECREQNPQIEWHAIYGMRNRFAHDYFAIDYKILWDILQDDLSLLRRQIVDMIGGE